MSAEENAGNRVPRTPENLFVRTNKQLQDFWQTIVRKFVEDVDPESFTDELYPDELLTHTSQESLAAGKDGRPRTDRARALWRVLSKHSLEVFRSKIAPKLCESYDWIIPQIFFATQEQQMKIMSLTLETDNPCLRHAVQKRLRPETMADLLLSHHCMSMDEHSSIVFGDPVKYSTEMTWDIIFGAFTKVSEDNSGKLLAETKALLERYLVGIPENFPEILHHAFPCACQTPGSCPSPSATEPNEKVQLMFERRLAAGRQPSLLSLDSSCTRVDMSTCSLYSSIRPDSEADTSSIGNAGQFFDKESLGSSDTNINTVSSDVCAVDMTGDANDNGRPSDRPGDAEGTRQDADDARVAEAQALNDQPQASANTDNSLRAKLHAFVEYYDDDFCGILRKGWQVRKMIVKQNLETTKQCWQEVFWCFKSSGCLTQMLKVLGRGVFLALFLSFICMVVLNASGVPSYGLNQFWLSVLKISGVVVVLYILYGVLVLPIVLLVVLGKILFCMFVASFIAFGMQLLQKATLKAKPVNQETPTPELIPLQEL